MAKGNKVDHTEFAGIFGRLLAMLTIEPVILVSVEKDKREVSYR
jgi:hypothetical protein